MDDTRNDSSADAPAEIGLFEAIYTQRAIRSFKPDPVPQVLLERILEAATKAPSGANSQPWAFVVVRDPELRSELGSIARVTFDGIYAGALSRLQPGDPPPMGNLKKMVDAIDTVPVWVVVCMRPSPGPIAVQYASIFPAVQNLLLAARGLGIGAVMTMLLGGAQVDRLRSALQIPDTIEPVAFIPMGYPDGATYGPTTRRPLAEVVHWDRWDNDKANSARLAYR